MNLAHSHSRALIGRVLCLAAASSLLFAAGCSSSSTATSSTTSTAPAAISVYINPGPFPLGEGGSQYFTAGVGNDSTNAGVTWSIGSGLGTLTSSTTSSVVYNAPATLASASTVTLTATSKTDNTKSATATITLSPITVSLNTASASLTGGSTQAFTASVSNDGGNAGVTWSIGAGAGLLSNSTTASTTYFAPAYLAAASTVTLTASSVTDPAKKASAAITLTPPTAPASQWVYYNTSGQLTYQTIPNADNNGSDGYDQIIDFSTAGYNQGAGPIPTVPAAAVVYPSNDTTGKTDVTNINAAIAAVAALPLTSGFRGAVELAAGNFYVNAILNINASGIVLRGAGSGTTSSSNTIVTLVSATTAYPFIVLGPYTTSGCSSATTCTNSALALGTSTTVTDAYVPAGAFTLDVASTANLSVGTTVIIQRPVTQNWINLMLMNPTQLISSGNCSGGACSWITVGNSSLRTDRTITAINGNRITLDAPMTDSIDSVYTGVNGATVSPYTLAGRVSNIGVENIRVVAPVPSNSLVPPTNSYQLVVAYAVLNGWARNLSAQDTLQSVDIENFVKQFTVANVAITHTVTQTASAQFMEYYLNAATQILMDNVSDVADNNYFYSTSSGTQGPNVLRNSNFYGSLSIEPHQRWATGLLIENTNMYANAPGYNQQGYISLRDRGDYGTGQGWAIGWGVVWNATGSSFTIQQPPGAQNWCIGCVGSQQTIPAPGLSTNEPQGAIDSSGNYVFPASLYQAQLTQRLGLGFVAQ